MWGPAPTRRQEAFIEVDAFLDERLQLHQLAIAHSFAHDEGGVRVVSHVRHRTKAGALRLHNDTAPTKNSALHPLRVLKRECYSNNTRVCEEDVNFVRVDNIRELLDGELLRYPLPRYQHEGASRYVQG